ncbi:hypothetical protein GCM10020229_41470 [Kitasatospora albolonga]|uniref:hypothetical protein n=1 Tax=Kitasatospora albolonga TaxID=68173 RepID=UPI0031E746FD
MNDAPNQFDAWTEHARQPEGEPGWPMASVRVPHPRAALKVAGHLRSIAPVGLAAYIPFGHVSGETLWALVVVIALLVASDVAVARRQPGASG